MVTFGVYAFSLQNNKKIYNLLSYQNDCHVKINCIYWTLGSTLYIQNVGIPIDTKCIPLVADLFLPSYERDFMLSLSVSNQADVIEAFSSS